MDANTYRGGEPQPKSAALILTQRGGGRRENTEKIKFSKTRTRRNEPENDRKRGRRHIFLVDWRALRRIDLLENLQRAKISNISNTDKQGLLDTF